jgi:hypothetical protein
MSTSGPLRVACLAAACAALAYLSPADRAGAAAAPLMAVIDTAQAAPQPERAIRRSRYIGIDFSMLRTRVQRQMLHEPSITLQLFPDV